MIAIFSCFNLKINSFFYNSIFIQNLTNGYDESSFCFLYINFQIIKITKTLKLIKITIQFEDIYNTIKIEFKERERERVGE
jgi:hypothetical protein